MRSTNDASSACFNSSLSLVWGRGWGHGAWVGSGILTDPWARGVSPEYRACIPYGQEEEPEVSRFEPKFPIGPRPSEGLAGHEVENQSAELVDGRPEAVVERRVARAR